MAFVSNDRITDTVESGKPTAVRAIRDIEKYFNETLNVSGLDNTKLTLITSIFLLWLPWFP